MTKNFKFKDGIFLTLRNFQQNNPNYIWGDVKATLLSNPQNYLVQIREIVTKTFDTLRVDTIWGVSLGGIPYIRVENTDKSKELTQFVGLQVRGKICYFDYETTESRWIRMPVYNPVTGKPFRVGVVARDSTSKHSKLMKFETGKIVDFTQRNLLNWIADDKSLYESVKEIKGKNASEKIFKSLLIYDDRNKIYVTPLK